MASLYQAAAFTASVDFAEQGSPAWVWELGVQLGSLPGSIARVRCRVRVIWTRHPNPSHIRNSNRNCSNPNPNANTDEHHKHVATSQSPIKGTHDGPVKGGLSGVVHRRAKVVYLDLAACLFCHLAYVLPAYNCARSHPSQHTTVPALIHTIQLC